MQSIKQWNGSGETLCLVVQFTWGPTDDPDHPTRTDTSHGSNQLVYSELSLGMKLPGKWLSEHYGTVRLANTLFLSVAC